MAEKHNTVERRHTNATGFALGVLGLMCLPIVAHSATVTHDSFAAGDEIRAAEINQNFADVVAAVSALEQVSFSDVINLTCASLDPDACASDQSVTLSVGEGRAVSLSLIGAEPNARIALESFAAEDAEAEIRVERRSDAGGWVVVSQQGLRRAASTSGNFGAVAVPCSAVGHVDRPAAGSHEYRVSVSIIGAALPEISVNDCQLVVRNVGIVQ